MIEATEKKEENMKERFITELKSSERDMSGLIQAMEEGGFFTAPCSGAHHLSKEGGLLEHSLNVLDYARKLNAAFGNPVKEESIIVTALLHDLGKMGDHGKPNYVEKILKSGQRSEAEPYTTNKDLKYIDHEIRSLMIAERYIRLSEEEEQAILLHNGLYGTFKYEIQGKETPLYMILHFADLWCSRVVEE
jgi:putative nucleotidyltransferase with HDIG domain